MISPTGNKLLCALFAIATLCAMGNAILYAHPLLSSMSVLAAIAFASITYRRWRAIRS
jgi:hypothetical protein